MIWLKGNISKLSTFNDDVLFAKSFLTPGVFERNCNETIECLSLVIVDLLHKMTSDVSRDTGFQTLYYSRTMHFQTIMKAPKKAVEIIKLYRSFQKSNEFSFLVNRK